MAQNQVRSRSRSGRTGERHHLVALLEFMVPTVEVDMEHHDGPGGEAGHEEPVMRSWSQWWRW